MNLNDSNRNKGGRPKGTKNKNTTQVKEAFQMAFQGIGGVRELTKWGKDPKNKATFYTLYSKLLPVQHSGTDGGPIQFKITKADTVVL